MENVDPIYRIWYDGVTPLYYPLELYLNTNLPYLSISPYNISDLNDKIKVKHWSFGLFLHENLRGYIYAIEDIMTNIYKTEAMISTRVIFHNKNKGLRHGFQPSVYQTDLKYVNYTGLSVNPHTLHIYGTDKIVRAYVNLNELYLMQPFYMFSWTTLKWINKNFRHFIFPYEKI